jgi:Fe-S cluster assembly protein SufD
MEPLASYVQSFEVLEAAGPLPRVAAVREMRRGALERFLALGFPTPRLEDWRFTNVAPIAEAVFTLAPNGASPAPNGASEIGVRLGLGGDAAAELVFTNGGNVPALAHAPGATRGLVVGDLGAVLAGGEGRDLLETHLGRHAAYDTEAFAALNTAFLRDGALVHAAAGVGVDRPVSLVFVAVPGAAPVSLHPRVLVVAEAGSRVCVVESYGASADGPYFTNAVTEIVAGPGAVVEHVRVQSESEVAFHVSTVAAVAARDARVTLHSVSLGGSLVRNDVCARLEGDGAGCALNGLYLACGRQHVDNHTVIDHARPHTSSEERYKGVLGGRAHGVFSGRIVVRPDAQKIVARQTNRNVLLSEDAVVNTKPQLEINADDVRCFHGATVGMLDEDALFYLCSRGLDRPTAEQMLIRGFVGDLVAAIGVPRVRERLHGRLAGWLAAGERGAGR